MAEPALRRVPVERSGPEETFATVFGTAIRAIENSGIPYAVIGGVGSASIGRPCWTHDIDIVIKAIAHDEQSARHWNDALSLVASCEIDWDYLLQRSVRGARRILSLLAYAQSNDLVVPNGVVEQLFAHIYDQQLERS